eukprot:COSAG01_NODE_315_length_19007_cov_18.180135_8_plen_228_part_00
MDTTTHPDSLWPTRVGGKLQQQGEGGPGAEGSELRAIRMVLSENFIIGEIPTPLMIQCRPLSPVPCPLSPVHPAIRYPAPGRHADTSSHTLPAAMAGWLAASRRPQPGPQQRRPGSCQGRRGRGAASLCAAVVRDGTRRCGPPLATWAHHSMGTSGTSRRPVPPWPDGGEGCARHSDHHQRRGKRHLHRASRQPWHVWAAGTKCAPVYGHTDVHASATVLGGGCRPR